MGDIAKIEASKHSAAGNLFLVISDIFCDASRFAGRILEAEKCDGLAIADIASFPSVDVRIFNRDGSEAETSGNGIACAVQAAARKHCKDSAVLNISDSSGTAKKAEISEGLSTVSEISVLMGEPILGSDEQNLAAKQAFGGSVSDAMFVDVGNPHIAGRVEDLGSVDIENDGLLAEERFGSPVNVEFVCVSENRRSAALKIWERGSGATGSCGSGSVAASAALEAWGLADLDNGLTVGMPGGFAEVSARNGAMAYSVKVEHLGWVSADPAKTDRKEPAHV